MGRRGGCPVGEGRTGGPEAAEMPGAPMGEHLARRDGWPVGEGRT